MSNSHGDLFTEIGRLVLAANAGQQIDVGATARDLAERYRNLGMTEATLEKVVTRSIGAISYSMARANGALQPRLEALRESAEAASVNGVAEAPQPEKPDAEEEAANAFLKGKQANGGRRQRRAGKKAVAAKLPADGKPSGAKSLFPSGVRLALLS